MVKDKKGGGSGENIRVCVRCRPISSKEKTDGAKEAVELDLTRNSVLVHHAVGDPSGPFSFDAVYNNSFKQKDIYIQECFPMVESVLSGYNATVFAYGQSGSGKTFTMTGVPSTDDAGIMPNAIAHIFDAVAKLASPNRHLTVKVSHLELYNNKPRDLLSDSGAILDIKQNMAKNFYVKDLYEEQVNSLEQTLQLFDSSIERRKTGCTDLNEHSSRSHAIFTITVESKDFEADPTTPQFMVSKLNLVDLAGSERQSKTGAAGDTLKEGCNINLSLSALGTVIDTIVKGKGHIPYRSSPLTMLLKDSLGGNSKTVMFANVGPSDRNVSETISTLRFAVRAKQITNKPVKNLDPKDARIQELMAEVDRLKERLGSNTDYDEVEKLKERVEELECEMATIQAAAEKDRLHLYEELKTKEAAMNKLQETLDKKEKQISTMCEENAMIGQNVASGEEEVNEVKDLVQNFIKSATNEAQLNKILESKSIPKTPESGRWDMQQLHSVLEGVKDTYLGIKKNSITATDVEKFLKEQAGEFETKFSNYKSQQEREKAHLHDANKSLTEKLETANNEVAEMKVKVSHQATELEKLTKKTEKEAKKMKEKMEKLLSETQAQVDSSEMEKTDLQTKYQEEAKQHKSESKKVKKELAETLDRFDKEKAAIKAKAEEAEKAFEKKLAEKEYDMKQSKATIEDLEALVKKFLHPSEKAKRKEEKEQANKEGGESPTTDDAKSNGKSRKRVTVSEEGGEGHEGGARFNDTMIMEDEDDRIDTQIFEKLQSQLKLQYRLAQVRQQQQLNLEALLQQRKEMSDNHTAMVEAKTQAAVDEVKLQLAEKELEMEEKNEKHQKDQEKLVKKINKKLQEFAQKEAEFDEERLALEEEKQDLLISNDELNKLNEVLEYEIEAMRRKMEDREAVHAQALKDSEEELNVIQQELKDTQDELSQALKLKAEVQSLEEESERLSEEKERVENSLKEKIISLENNRQMLKWTNGLVEKEKKKVEDLQQAMEDFKVKYEEMEEYWREQNVENANNLVAINNRKLQEAARQTEILLAEEAEKTKDVKTKLKKAKNTVQKEKQKYDELLLELDQTQRQFEEFKVSSMRMYRDKHELQIEDSSSSIRDMINQQAAARQQAHDAFAQGYKR